MAEQLPNFNTLAESMRASANGLANAATEMERMPNIPVVDVAAQMNQILLELRAMRRDLGAMRSDLNRESRNNFARLVNSKITNNITPLEELLSVDGQQIQGFPQTSADIHELDSVNLNRLLIALGLPASGGVNDRKNRLRQYIGLTVL